MSGVSLSLASERAATAGYSPPPPRAPGGVGSAAPPLTVRPDPNECPGPHDSTYNFIPRSCESTRTRRHVLYPDETNKDFMNFANGGDGNSLSMKMVLVCSYKT